MDTKSIACVFAQELHKAGVIPFAEPKSVAYEDAGIYKS